MVMQVDLNQDLGIVYDFSFVGNICEPNFSIFFQIKFSVRRTNVAVQCIMVPILSECSIRQVVIDKIGKRLGCQLFWYVLMIDLE